MPYRACRVSFLYRGQAHAAEVDAESVYEAACLALKSFHDQRFVKGPRRQTVLHIEVQAPLKMQIKVADVLDWLYSKPGRTPQQRERKRRLQDLLAADRR